LQSLAEKYAVLRPKAHEVKSSLLVAKKEPAPKKEPTAKKVKP
jgi:hypothetical protein